jgi:hypothetical protein
MITEDCQFDRPAELAGPQQQGAAIHAPVANPAAAPQTENPAGLDQHPQIPSAHALARASGPVVAQEHLDPLAMGEDARISCASTLIERRYKAVLSRQR